MKLLNTHRLQLTVDCLNPLVAECEGIIIRQLFGSMLERWGVTKRTPVSCKSVRASV